jgi:hypothetical protein
MYATEQEFENHLRCLISTYICANDQNVILLDSKKIADIVISKNGDDPGLYFIEVKHLKSNMGRLGIGGINGSGYQPEILTKRPDYLESNLRWAMYSEKHDENNGIVFVTTEKLINSYLQGGQVGEKYNGIKQDIFIHETGLSDIEFISSIKKWLNC